MQQKKKVRPLFAALLAAVLMLALLPLPAYAAPQTGYTLENGVLTIYDNAGMSPWREQAVTSTVRDTVQTLVMAEGMTYINAGVLAGCKNLKNVTLPSTLEEIYGEAFLGCTSLTSLTIPPKVTSIGNDVFNGCKVLTTLTFQGQTAPTLGPDVFANLTQNITINVPHGATGYDKGTWLTNTGLVTLNIKYADPPAPAAPAPEAEGVPHVCYFGDWQYSDEHHWKRCSCMALSDYAPHVFNSARVCTVCGYGAKPKKVNPQTSVYDSGLPQSFSKPLLFHFAPLIGA